VAAIVAFPARDSRTRFECLRHAVEAQRVQRSEVEIERQRAELTALGHEVADELSYLGRAERIARLAELDRRPVRSFRESGVFDPGPEVA
jgi:hypothetical protein